ncbi:MAG TPA: outer membrane protein assembly factor BamA [Gemmatimonadales bacterium]|nr:outer membrane protein assembly factor BamA [Gemmatimonadales bacterium]
MIRQLSLAILAGAVVLSPRPSWAQDEGSRRTVDSIAVTGARRNTSSQVIQASGLTTDHSLDFRDLQVAIRTLYATGQYDDVQILEQQVEGRRVLLIRVRERPLLTRWSVEGAAHIPEGKLREKSTLSEGLAMDPAAVARTAAHIDSLYRKDGFYLVRVRARREYYADSTQVRLTFDIQEGRRVAVSRVEIEGNSHFSDEEIVKRMSTRPEGFWWFRPGDYDDEKVRDDLLSHLPQFYGSNGYVDFQVLGDTLLVNNKSGKATLVIRVHEGERRKVGTFEIVGNRRFSTDELERYFPFARQTKGGILTSTSPTGTLYFDQVKWDAATRAVQTLYYNNGYIYVNLRPDVIRRDGPDGKPLVDLRWVVNEGQPAIVNKIEIVGNTLTRDHVIRNAIVLLPGDVFRQDALVHSYQNISNLGFFEPLPPPDTRAANDQGDVDIIFHVTEKHTGQINFGASLGQGTGIGGFIGLEEPNIFGQGKRGSFQWTVGQNLDQFSVSYTDPAIRQSRISGTLGVHKTRVVYTIANLGTLKSQGGNLQIGFPTPRDRYTRLYLTYALETQTFTGTSSDTAFSFVYGCNECVRSTLTATLTRDTRIDLPFPSAGTLHSVSLSQSGGPLGGTGDYQRVDAEGRWYATLSQIGEGHQPLKFVLGLTARSGFVFGYAPYFNQLFTMGGTQFGIPLRGYDEFSITPRGYDPLAQRGVANPAAFGKAFLAMTAELGARVSQALYASAFYDAGNVYGTAGDFNPTRLMRGAGIGLSLVSPVGPMGIDLAYGFDRRNILGQPAPGWKVHFRLGNPFTGGAPGIAQ